MTVAATYTVATGTSPGTRRDRVIRPRLGILPNAALAESAPEPERP